MKVSDYVISFLKQEGVKTIFGYQGGAITHLVDSISKIEDIEFLSTYHEQGAAFAAEGYARIKGDIGVAIATSGPGATNLITGIGSAFFDSIPCIYLTGQVNTYEYKKSEEVRQEGFQETDIVSIIKPITKFAVKVTRADQIRFLLEKGIYIARSGRQGPVLIDIPMNIQREEINCEELKSYYQSEEYYMLKGISSHRKIDTEIDEIINVLKTSDRPVILIGGGIRLAHAQEELSELVKYTEIPVVSTLMGLDSIERTNPQFVGFLGSYGNRYANLTVANADTILILGARLTSRQTSTLPNTFARGAKIIHIDIDKSEIGRVVNPYLGIECDLYYFIRELNKQIKEKNFNRDIKQWKIRIKHYQEKYPSYPTQQEFQVIDPNIFMRKLSEMTRKNAIICADVGQNQMWLAQSFQLKEGQRLLNSGGMGAMGFALPSAIGACKANVNTQVIAIAGDGGIQINIQELQTIVREKLPIKIIIINNKALGMIRHFQELYFESNYYGTIQGYSVPDFVEIGKAYGICSERITNYDQLMNMKEKLSDQNQYLFEVILQNDTYVIPKLGIGRPIEDQEPLVSEEELESNMIIPSLRVKKV